MRRLLGRAFPSLSVRNFRLFIFGQAISLTGMWMQRLAQSWLVLELTGSGFAVGGVIAFQFLPVLLFALVGGIAADRIPKRGLLMSTQALAGILAVALGVLVALGQINVTVVYLFAFGLGVTDAFDNPTRQAFITEIVGTGNVANAVGVFSVVLNSARIIGPALAGVLIASLGIAWCFLLNGASYFVLFAMLVALRAGELGSIPVPVKGTPHLGPLFAHVWAKAELKVPLILIALVSTFSYEFDVVLPLAARFVFGGTAGTLGAMFAVMGVGSVVGGVVAASRDRKPNRLSFVTAAFAVSLIAAAAAPTLWLELGVLFFAGASVTGLIVEGNVLLQLHSRPEFRGRVLALRAIAFFGTRPLGAPIIGWIGEIFGARTALLVGGVVAAGVSWWARATLNRPLEMAGPDE